MLHGLLLILKIAGIILAVLLGIVLAAAAAVLFVPVRYAADAQYDKNSGKKPVLHVRVTWLLHLFRFFMEFDEDFKMRAQVLFFSLYDSERTIEPEIKEQKGKKSKKKQKTLKRTVFDEQSQKSGVQAQEVRGRIEQEPLQETESGIEVPQTAEENPDESEAVYSPEQTDIQERKKTVKKNWCVFRKKPSLAEKFKCFGERIKQVCRRIKAFFIRIAQTICGIFDKSVSLKDAVQEKITHFSEILHDEENRELVHFLWEQLKRLLQKICPKKYRLRIRYGFEDSETTGWLAVRLAVLYGLLGLDIELIPDFEESVFEGEGMIKGKIRLVGILMIAGKVYFNRLVQKKLLKKSSR